MSSFLFLIRNATPDDQDDILRLNDAVVEVTSPMDAANYRSIAEQTSLNIVAEIDGKIVGCLLALRDGTAYKNGNYAWFSERYQNFIYIDRVIVDNQLRGSGIGRAFYTHVIDWAHDQQLPFIAAEISLNPPNPGSLRFHQKLDFEEVGTRQLPHGKTVSMMLKKL
ncbi:GNAT family N-acetyltransferase [Verrucomicrobiaceae bacterium 227]